MPVVQPEEEPCPEEPCPEEEESTEEVGGSTLFQDQMRLMPFLLQTGEHPAAQEYVHPLPAGRRVTLAEFPQGVGQAAQAGQPAWCWRVWDAAKLLADRLPADMSGRGLIELGAGAGLCSIAAALLGAEVAAATDLARALPLARHNLGLNGGVLLEGGLGPDSDEEQGGPVICPGSHRLVKELAEHEDFVCNICGLEDELLDGGIPEGEPVHSCRECDFDICGPCNDAAARGDWSGLPGWFRLQCAPEMLEPSSWRLGDRSTVMLAPWDLIATVDSMPQQAEKLVRVATAAAVKPPDSWLVVAADVSCHAALIGPLVAAVSALSGVLPEGSQAMLVHERREDLVDRALLDRLTSAGLAFTLEELGQLQLISINL